MTTSLQMGIYYMFFMTNVRSSRFRTCRFTSPLQWLLGVPLHGFNHEQWHQFREVLKNRDALPLCLNTPYRMKTQEV